MGGAHRDIDQFILVHDRDAFVDRYARGATDHDPVLGAVVMLLQR